MKIMELEVLVITWDGQVRTQKLPNHGPGTQLHAMQALVARCRDEAALVQCVPFVDPDSIAIPKAGLWVNEEGKLNGCLFNPRATAAWYAYCPYMQDEDAIFGTCFITGVPDVDGNVTNIPGRLRDKLLIEVPKLPNDDRILRRIMANGSKAGRESML